METIPVEPGKRPSGDTRASARPAASGAGPVPEQLGPYRIGGLLGRGGMGVVYRAFDPGLDRTVAVKVLAPVLAGDADSRERFLREARSMARLQHPNVAQVHFAGEDDGVPFFAMELIPGETALQRLERAALPVDEAVAIAIQAATGLHAAHQHGLIHRDVKPSNLMVAEDGTVKVLDFGLARVPGDRHLTAADLIMGSPDYISPEQGRGEEPDHRSDIYALGVTLYQLIAGRLPFEGKSPLAVIHQHIHDDPPPLDRLRPEVPPTVCRVIERMLAKEPDRRQRCYGELLSELSGVRQSPEARIVREWHEASPHHSFARFALQVVLDPGRALTRPRMTRPAEEVEGFLFRVSAWGVFLFAVMAPARYWGPPWVLLFAAGAIGLPLATRAVDRVVCRLARWRSTPLELLAIEALCAASLVPAALLPRAGALWWPAAALLALLYLRARAAGLALALNLRAAPAWALAVATSAAGAAVTAAGLWAFAAALRHSGALPA